MKKQMARLSLFISCLATISFTPSLSAIGSTAGTEIRNQSTATYTDSTGDPQVTTSNEVINIVDPVYGLVITPNQPGTNAPGSIAAFNAAWDDTADEVDDIAPGQNKRSAPGNLTYFSLLLQNTANVEDSFDLTVSYNNDALDAANNDDDDSIVPGEIKIYYDANGNGQVDPGDTLLDSMTPAGSFGSTTALTVTPEIASNGYANLIVSVFVPISADHGDAIYLDVDATSTGNPSKSDQYSNMLRVEVVESEGVLTVSKSSDVNAAVAGQTIKFTINGSNTGGAPVYGVDENDRDIIDIDGSGVIDGLDDVEGILITDVLDDALLNVGDDYANVTVSAISPAKAKFLYWDPNLTGGAGYTLTKPTYTAGTGTSARVALFIPDTNQDNDVIEPVLAVGQSFSFSFTVNVIDNDATVADTTVINSATAIYNPTATATDPEETESNDAIVSLGSDPTNISAAVVIGPLGFPAATASDNDLDSTNHPRIDNIGLIADGDITYAGTTSVLATTAALAKTTARNAGDIITIPLTVQNNGNAIDVFNITKSAAGGNDSNAIIQLFKSDGITPLADTNGDGIPDVGKVAVGATATVVAVITIPDNSEDADEDTFTVYATSSNSTAQFDTTTINLAGVIPAGVDIALDEQIGGDDNPASVSNTAGNNDDDDLTGISVAPGSTKVFNVDIANVRPANQDGSGTPSEDLLTLKADTYNLSWAGKTNAGATSATAGKFIVQFYEDIDGNDSLAESELLPISDTGEVQALTAVGLAGVTTGEIFNLAVRVTVPEGTPAGDYYVHVTATSSNNSSKSDTMVILVRVPAVSSIDIIPDNTATVVPGGTVTFKHRVVNNGNAAATAVMTLPTTLPSGWTATFISCTDGSVLGNTYTTAIIPAPATGVDNTVEVCVRVFVPTNASIGATIPLDVTATHSTVPSASDSAVDIINVISGNLALTKVNSPTTSVDPGESITYTTTYQNLGSASVTNVVVFDAIPANTTVLLTGISGVEPDGTSRTTAADPAFFEYSTDGGLTFTEFSTAPASAAAVTHLRFDLGGTGVGTGGPVAAGESGSFTFSVIVH